MQIEGKFKRIVYTHPQNGVTIASYEVDGRPLIIHGMFLPTSRKIEYIFDGEYVNDPVYGKQFRASDFTHKKEEGLEGIISYLSCGVIKGIGLKTAQKIVAHFGQETLNIIDNDIDRLSEVKGITSKKLEKIKSNAGNIELRETIVKLGEHGISPTLARKAYDVFKSETMDVIKNKPYLLSMVSGITFKVADEIGKQTLQTSAYEKSYDRFKACARFVLYANESGGLKEYIGTCASGSTGMNKDDFGMAMLKLLRISEIDGSFILENTISMIKDGGLICKRMEGSQYIFLPGIYRIEDKTAECIARLSLAEEARKDRAAIIALIEEAQKEKQITLDTEQKEAVVNAFTNNLSLIVGPPGTGKTTIIKVISYVDKKLCARDRKQIFLAPTGKAASTISESISEMASTIHSGLGINTEIISDVLEEEEIIYENCLIIIDEMSMVDARLAYRTFSSIDKNCRVVLVGDDEQLPSVGAGAVLRDLIDSNVIPVTRLKKIHRQDSDCNIFVNLHKVRAGRSDLSYGDDFTFTEENDIDVVENMLVETYLQKVKEYGIENVMLLSPFKNHQAGVHSLNTIIQDRLNPARKGSAEMYGANSTVFRVNDIVMQLKNRPDDQIVNGDIGTVKQIFSDDGEMMMIVEFSSGQVTYTTEDAQELALAYSYTVHKSQGSEAKCVITCIHNMHSIMLKRNLFYTAFTRGRKEVKIIGQKSALIKAINTEDKTKRYTAFKMLLKMRMGVFLDV